MSFDSVIVVWVFENERKGEEGNTMLDVYRRSLVSLDDYRSFAGEILVNANAKSLPDAKVVGRKRRSQIYEITNDRS